MEIRQVVTAQACESWPIRADRAFQEAGQSVNRGAAAMAC